MRTAPILIGAAPPSAFYKMRMNRVASERRVRDLEEPDASLFDTARVMARALGLTPVDHKLPEVDTSKLN